LLAPDSESLVRLYADALLEDGIDGHFCLLRQGEAETPLLGDRPDLIASGQPLVIDCGAPFTGRTRMLLAPPRDPLTSDALARLRGYAELYGARALALRDLADDVPTGCGLTLRQRFVLGRRLAGLATIDIAAEAGLSVDLVAEVESAAVRELGAPDLPEAIAFAARRGWLAVTSLENCSSSSEKLTYKTAKNG
jgi:DNA-binding CsgD family transcriptional regulator